MNLITKCAFLIVIIAVIIAYVPVIDYFMQFEEFTHEDEEYRKWAVPEGKFVNLSRGSVHYVLEGPRDGSLVNLHFKSICEKNDCKCNVYYSLLIAI